MATIYGPANPATGAIGGMGSNTSTIAAAPPGGYKKGGWYWDSAVGNARQWDGTQFGAPGQDIVNPDGSSKLSSSGGGTATTAQTESSNNPLQQVNDIIQNSYQNLQSQVAEKFGQYTAGNPFNVDQVLAEKTNEAKEQVDPYYDQMLGDYLTGAQNKINRGNVDTQQLLGELGSQATSYSTSSQNQLADAVLKANQGYADNGLFGSGDQMRSTGSMTQASQQDLSDYMRQNALKQLQATQANQRNIQDVNLGINQETTQNAADKYTAEQTRAGQLTQNAGQQYINGFTATLPPQLQAANGFDMLKSLGIPSA